MFAYKVVCNFPLSATTAAQKTLPPVALQNFQALRQLQRRRFGFNWVASRRFSTTFRTQRRQLAAHFQLSRVRNVVELQTLAVKSSQSYLAQ